MVFMLCIVNKKTVKPRGFLEFFKIVLDQAPVHKGFGI